MVVFVFGLLLLLPREVNKPPSHVTSIYTIHVPLYTCTHYNTHTYILYTYITRTWTYLNIIIYYIILCNIQNTHYTYTPWSPWQPSVGATDAVGHDPVVCFSTTFRLSTPMGLNGNTFIFNVQIVHIYVYLNTSHTSTLDIFFKLQTGGGIEFFTRKLSFILYTILNHYVM